MKVFWLGLNDEGACVLHWHRLRRHLEKHHGVELFGPGYEWPLEVGNVVRVSDLLRRYGTPDWIVLDDANARGYLPLQWDVRPPCRVAWREHDWHNGARVQTGMRIQPDLILGTTERDHSEFPLRHGDPFRRHPGWRLVPHPVCTETFRYDPTTPHEYRLGFYGMVNKAYPERQAAAPVIRARKVERGDVWMPVHGGYWRDGRGSAPGKTFYNGALAEALRKVECLWVSGGMWRAATLKYFEGAASGCFLIGKKPIGWNQLFSRSAFIECEPEEINEVVDSLNPVMVAKAARMMAEQVNQYHSVPARAAQIMWLLTEAL